MLHNQVSLLTAIMTAPALVLALLPVQAEQCVFVAVAWEAVGESQGTADARSPPRWLTGGQARQTSTGCKKLRQKGYL